MAEQVDSGIKNICAALLKARAEFGEIHKDKTAKIPTKSGGSFSYNYADLGSVLAAVEPALRKHGIALTQPVALLPEGAMAVSTNLTYIGLPPAQAGSFLSSMILIPGNLTAQELGSWITYGRRYTLCGLLAIVADEDDDGAAATRKPEKPKAAKPEAPAGTHLSPQQKAELWDYARALYPEKPAEVKAVMLRLVRRHGVEKTEQLDPAKFETYKNELDAEAKGEE